VNIAAFALGCCGNSAGAEAVPLVRLDGEVSSTIMNAIRGIPAIKVARLLRLAWPVDSNKDELLSRRTRPPGFPVAKICHTIWKSFLDTTARFVLKL
jgi:hypothetical protein